MARAVPCRKRWLGSIGVGARWDVGRSGADGITCLCLLKNHATSSMPFCAHAAVQILGGMGSMRGSVSGRIDRERKVMVIGRAVEDIVKERAARQLGL